MGASCKDKGHLISHAHILLTAYEEYTLGVEFAGHKMNLTKIAMIGLLP